MRLKFTKMQGAGNDFVVLDGVRQRVALAPSQWRALADRHFGVGADQLLLVEPGDGPDVDFVYRIFNADGGEVEQCGNGARCFVRFVLDQGLTAKRAIRVRTMAGVIEPRMEDDGRVTVDMGEPVLDPGRVPFDASGLEGRREGEDTLWPLVLPGGTRWVSVVSMGNPHAVQLVDDVDTAPVAVEGPPASFRCCRRNACACASSSAAPARRSPAAAAPARRSSPASAAAGSRRASTSRPGAACSPSTGAAVRCA
jgi:diaminopimelate epimerase